MKPDISTVDYALDPAPRTFDPEKDFSNDPIVRRIQEIALAGSRPFLGRMYVCRGTARRLVWEVETNSDDAASVVLENIEIRARENGVQFRSLIRVLATELRIKKGQATALAFEWAFPHSAAETWARLVDHRPRARGRPRRVDELTTLVNRLGRGWWRATGERPGTSDRAPFVRALDAAKDFLPLHRRDRGPIGAMREWVRREARKIRSDDVQFVMRASPAIYGTASAVDPN